MLDSTTNRYKCFGCGKGGDIISFVKESNGLDFNGAICYLLKMYCPDVDIPSIYEKKDPDEIALQNKRILFMRTMSMPMNFSANNIKQILPKLLLVGNTLKRTKVVVGMQHTVKP